MTKLSPSSNSHSPSLNSPSLEIVQRWMMSVITHPGGITAGLQSDAARNELDVSPAHVEEVIHPSQRCTSLERLAVYGNAYVSRLVECLEAEFPAVRQAVGEAAFHGFAAGYLQQHPPGNYTLNTLGQHFADYLSRSRPQIDSEATQPQWTDFVVELADLERLYAEIFDGPGEEHSSLLSAEDLRAISPDKWSEIRLAVSQALRLRKYRFPVHEFITAVRQGGAAEFPRPQTTWLVVNRRDFIVRRQASPEVQWRLLQQLQQGETLGTAIETAFQGSEEATENLAQQLNIWFRNWTAAGFFRHVLEDSSTSSRHVATRRRN